MSVHLDRRVVGATVALLAAAAIIVSVVLLTRSSGPPAGSLAAVRAALHPADVSAAEAALGRAAERGASSGRLIVLTNELLDLTRNDSTADRRAAADAGLAAVSGYGCQTCEQALEEARPG